MSAHAVKRDSQRFNELHIILLLIEQRGSVA